MSKRHNKKLFSSTAFTNSKLYNESNAFSGVCISITYLDENKYGLGDLFTAVRGNKHFINDLNDFISAARQLNSVSELIKKFASHKKVKNDDEKSLSKVQFLQNTYNLEVEHLIHLHCNSGGNGKFVIHGFQTDNIFHIVWLDPQHEVHK